MPSINFATVYGQAMMSPKRVQQDAALAVQAVLDGGCEPLLAHQAKAARMLDCSRFTLRRLEKDGKIRPVLIRGLKRYRITDIRALAGAE